MAFCTQCGKQVENGQVCECSASATTTPPLINRAAAMGFLESMKNRMGIGEPERNATDCYERGKRIVPDSIKASEGEIPVRQYNIAVLRALLRFERAEGRMQVTNKRVVFRAPGRAIGGRTTLQHEYAIDEVAGIEAKRNFKFSILHFFGGLILLALTAKIGSTLTLWAYDSKSAGTTLGILLWGGGLVPFFMIHKRFLIKLLALGVSLGSIWTVSWVYSILRLVSERIGHADISVLQGMLSDGGYFSVLRQVSGRSLRLIGLDNFVAILVILTVLITLFGLFLHFMRPNLVIKIKNKMGVAGGPNNKKGVAGGPVDISIEGTRFTEVMPTNESERAIREIGAMIGDIQKLGDLGVDKWIEKIEK